MSSFRHLSQSQAKQQTQSVLQSLKSARILLSLALLAISSQALPALAQPANDYPDWRLQFGEPNPASLTFYGTGRLQLPSFRMDVGSNLATGKVIQDATLLGAAFSDLTKNLAQNQDISAEAAVLKVNLDGFLTQFETPTRLDYDLDVNLIGFGGAPIARFEVGGKPLSFGAHLSSNTRGYFQSQFSDEFTSNLKTLTTSLPELLTSGPAARGIITDSNALLTQVNQLQASITDLGQEVRSFLNNPQNNPQSQFQSLNQSLGQVNGQLDALLPTARELTSLVSNTTTSSRSLLDSLESLGGGGVSLSAASDLHMTLGVSAAYPVFESEHIQVSLGGRVKLFVLPFNIPLESLGVDSQAGLMGKLDLTEISGLQQAEDVRNALATFDKAAADVNQIVEKGTAVSAQLKEVQTDLSNNNLPGVISKGQALAQQALDINNDLGTVQASVQTASSQIAGIQQTLLQEFQDISYKGTLTTPSGAGVGVDLGIDAILYRYLRLGLQLQNPLVLWPGSERPFEGRLVRNQNGQTTIQPTVNVDDSQAKNVNYTATVPFSVLMNARYRFDGVLPQFTDFYGLANLEVITNGRTPALTLGLQKFFNDYAYAGLGGRVGGISSMVYLEAGLNPLSGFGLDAQLGISPTGQGLPVQGLDWLSVARLGLSYRF